MRRGDVVIVLGSGDYKKVRPAVVIQNDLFADAIDSRSVCLMTTELARDSPVRLTIEPSAGNGLRETSQVQIDKILTYPPRKLRPAIGRLTDEQMRDLDLRLKLHLDL